jgi:hypothetical protein
MIRRHHKGIQVVNVRLKEDSTLPTILQGQYADTVEDAYLGVFLDLALMPRDVRQGLKC